MAEEEPDEPSEGESEESSSRQPPGESAGEESPDEPGDEDDELTPEELAEEVLQENPPDEEEPETEESDDSEEEAGEEASAGSPAEADEDVEGSEDDELSPEELAEEVLQEESPPDEESDPTDEPTATPEEPAAESPPSEEPDEAGESDEGTEDEELSPEELAEEVLADEPESEEETEPDEVLEEDEPETSEEPEGEDDATTEGSADDGLSPEEVLQEESPAEEEPEIEQEPPDTTEDPADESSSTDDPDDSTEETEDEESTPEELAEEEEEEEEEEAEAEDLEQQDVTGETEAEKTEPAASDEAEPGPEEESGESEETDEPEDAEKLSDDRSEQSGEPEPSEPDEAEEAGPEEEFEEPSEEDVPDEEDGDEDEAASIQDMLEQEAKRSREEEEEEEEDEELPEGYMTVEQLPEQEEFEFPAWSKTTGWVLLWLVTAGLVIWFLAMPLWEVYLMNQMKNSMDRNNYAEARSWAEVGLFLNGAFVKNDGPFLADYLKQLLDNREFERFRTAYRELAPGIKPPSVQQTYAEYLLNRGRWEEARSSAETLQRWVNTRGMGYLFHAKASLELGNLEMAQSDLNQVTNWMTQHPSAQRILRDIYYEQGDYRNAMETSNQLQDLAETDPWEMKVDDYVRLAQINKNLDKRRVAQQMLERALELNPNHKGALQELGRQYLLEGRWERAEPLVSGSDYREGYRSLFPFEGFGWWAGAEIELSNGNLPSGIRYVERAVDLEPRNPEAHRVKGTLYMDRLSQPGQAVRSYERARELGLDRLTFYNKLGQAYYRSGKYLSAAKTFEALDAALGDTQPALTYNIGSAYLGAGEFDKARKRIRKAFNRGFENQKSYNQWGLLLELEGRTQDALAKYFEGIEWGRRQNEPVDLVQSNLDRAFSKENPDPLSEWLAPLSSDIAIPTWRTMDGEQNNTND